MGKEAKKQIKQLGAVSMPLVNPDAAGIDISATFHVVAVPAGRDEVSVKRFDAFTEDLQALAAWLKQCRVTTVAMESTGVYWRPVFMVLAEAGFEVLLVNARHVKNVTGKKTDDSDAAWIQKLHSCGLLRSSFLPDDATTTLRTLARHRKKLLEDAAKHVLRMQKALELMNIKLHSTISDLMGKTGRAIVEAIIGGEREAEKFMVHVHPSIKADRETLVKSLTGNWRDEHLFTLAQDYEMYKFIHGQVVSCDAQIEQCLQKMAAANNEGIVEAIEPVIEPVPQEKEGLADGVKKKGKREKKGKKKAKNQPSFNTKEYLRRIHGVDVTAIPGISDVTALQLLAELGPDLSKFETEGHFAGWLNLCPNNKESGGKLISSKVKKQKAGIASQAFRAAANSIQRSDNYLADFFRRMKAKGGNKYAIIATAKKLSVIYYKMVREKVEFCPIDAGEYRKKYNEQKIARLEKQLAKLKTAA
jgi:transposase